MSNPSLTTLITSLFRRAPSKPTHPINFPYTWKSNPYQCQKTWPPDFTQLSQKHQFRLERRYRRRSKLKWARPRWSKATKLVQWGSIVFIAVYGVLFLEVEDPKVGGRRRSVFDGVREVWWGQVGGDVGEQEEGQREGQKG